MNIADLRSQQDVTISDELTPSNSLAIDSDRDAHTKSKLIDENGNLFTSLNPLPVDIHPKHTSILDGTHQIIYNAGVLNTSTHNLSVIGEGHAVHSDLIKVLGSSTEKVMQIFRASHNNLIRVKTQCRLNAGTVTTIDNFNSGVTSNWTSNSSNTVRSQETTIVYEGAGSMKVTTKPASTNNRITRTFSPFDASTADSIYLFFRSNKTSVYYRYVISDGTNSLASPSFSANVVNTFEQKLFLLSNFV